MPVKVSLAASNLIQSFFDVTIGALKYLQSTHHLLILTLDRLGNLPQLDHAILQDGHGVHLRFSFQPSVHQGLHTADGTGCLRGRLATGLGVVYQQHRVHGRSRLCHVAGDLGDLATPWVALHRHSISCRRLIALPTLRQSLGDLTLILHLLKDLLLLGHGPHGRLVI